MSSRLGAKKMLKTLFQNNGADYIDMTPINEVRISSEEFLRRQKKNARSVKDATFIPPQVGDQHFGYFVIPSDYYGVYVYGKE